MANINESVVYTGNDNYRDDCCYPHRDETKFDYFMKGN